jgi:hypothetical protein
MRKDPRQNMIDERDLDAFSSFLTNCDVRIRQFYDYWRSKCSGRHMPSRADLDPLEMKIFLPGIIIVDVVPDERLFVYRLVGTREVQLRGNDPTGKSLAEGYFGESFDESMRAYQRVVDTSAPFYESEPFETPHGRLSNEEILFLPLSDDGKTINKILVFSCNKLESD